MPLAKSMFFYPFSSGHILLICAGVAVFDLRPFPLLAENQLKEAWEWWGGASANR